MFPRHRKFLPTYSLEISISFSFLKMYFQLDLDAYLFCLVLHFVLKYQFPALPDLSYLGLALSTHTSHLQGLLPSAKRLHHNSCLSTGSIADYIPGNHCAPSDQLPVGPG